MNIILIILLIIIKNLIPIQEVMPIIGWNELEKISLEYITGKVNAIVSKLIQENQLKAYDDDVLKKTYSMAGLCISQYMRKNLKELADKKKANLLLFTAAFIELER
ncbi:hypothetical protein [Escherichia coli]|uniref:hypothetical protein n=1 Tax=Escherichia coli TaxID=562 RepID=UPI004069496D